MPFDFRYFFVFFEQTNFIMNQILNTKLKKSNSSKEKKYWFLFQFIFSILVLSVVSVGSIFYFGYLEKKEDFSNRLISNYNIYRLYQRTENSDTTEESSHELFGMIEIPKINLSYPVFSHLTEELLKSSPCKFYGDSPKVNGNICIAGHNYDNSLFFSKISTLKNGDEILISDLYGNQYMYFVTQKYEVSPNDLSPILNYDKNEKILTLVTCNNFNSNRIILKAKQNP